MKLTKFKVLAAGLLLSTSISMTSCKSKPKETESTNTTTVAPAPAPEPAPVVISGDDSLRTGLRDATKDYPTVKADVNNGEVTLTGTIQRSKVPNLMQSISSLRPKKINNQLTIK